MFNLNGGSAAKPFNSKTKVDKEIVTSAGWGVLFSWEDPSDTASYSSCMTTQAGPIDYRFTFCDMNYVKV